MHRSPIDEEPGAVLQEDTASYLEEPSDMTGSRNLLMNRFASFHGRDA